MKKFNSYILLLTLAILSFGQLQAQEEGPFLEELYDYEVTSDVIYGFNATILSVLGGDTEARTRPLNMDVYTPVGDNNDERPVMLVLHTGNFLPFPNNNGTGGTIRDSTVVEACKSFAKRGYLACAVDYRIGWNPIDPNQDIRTFFLINAAYRGIQDIRSAIRFLRASEVDGVNGGPVNPYGISGERIGAFGIGTGGYIVSGLASLDEYSEILLPKFLIDLGTGPIPMVVEAINGDINGTTYGIVPPAGYPVLPPGDTLCIPNSVNYASGDPIESHLNFAVNLGGAVGDVTWIDENIPPWISFAVPDDGAAPYTTGTLTVPGTGDPVDPTDDFAVVEVSGSYDIQKTIAGLGFNDIFDTLDDNVRDHDEVADMRNDGYDGLFPLPNDIPPSSVTTITNHSSPWNFYAADNANVPPNPAPEPAFARTYWDTIMNYTTPRACLALNLDCTGLVGLEEIDPSEVGFQMAPNPATDRIFFSTEDQEISSIFLYDLTGKMVSIHLKVNSNTFELRRGNLADGMYMAVVKFKDGYFSKKVVFK